MTKVKERVKKAEERTNTNPTEGQKTGGNYKKGKFTIKGLKISIENPVESTRCGIGKNGNMWSNKMPFTYGYFRGTVGKDGDPIDVYLGPVIDEDFDVYIIDQVDEDTRAFDEHKVMFGFESKEQAREAYSECFEDTWTGFGNITTISLKKFKQWISNKNDIKWPASKLSMSKKMLFKNSAQAKIKLIQINGEVFDEEIRDGIIVQKGTLADLKEQAGDESAFDTLILEIASPGGSVSEGLMIMVWLDYLSKQKKEIITVVTANAYSIASLIMLAADHRMISKHGKVMVHNPMVPQLKYANADELEKYASELRDLESVMYELYEIFTGLTTAEIKSLMDNETYLSPEEAIKNGFADVVIDIEPKSYQMAINSKQEINMFKTLNILNKVIGMVSKSEFVNQLYYDNEGGEIEIFQADPSTYLVGDRTNIEKGEVTLSDGSKLLIVDFVITSIEKGIPEEETIPVEETTEEVVEEIIPIEGEEIIPEEVPKGKDDMPSKVIEKTESTVTTKEVVAKEEDDKPEAKAEEDDKPKAGEFNEGPAPKEVETKAVVEEDKPEAKAEEDKPEAKAEEDKPEAIAEVDENGDPIVEEAEAGPKQDALEIIAVLQEGMQILKDQVEQLKEEQAQMKADSKAKYVDMEKFEDVATEAIEALAKASSSTFKPEAREVAEKKESSGSIFQTMKKKRGL